MGIKTILRVWDHSWARCNSVGVGVRAHVAACLSVCARDWLKTKSIAYLRAPHKMHMRSLDGRTKQTFRNARSSLPTITPQPPLTKVYVRVCLLWKYQKQ